MSVKDCKVLIPDNNLFEIRLHRNSDGDPVSLLLVPTIDDNYVEVELCDIDDFLKSIKKAVKKAKKERK